MGEKGLDVAVYQLLRKLFHGLRCGLIVLAFDATKQAGRERYTACLFMWAEMSGQWKRWAVKAA
jgi:hypothetical protein